MNAYSRLTILLISILLVPATTTLGYPVTSFEDLRASDTELHRPRQELLQELFKESEDGLTEEQLAELDNLLDELGTDSIDLFESPVGTIGLESNSGGIIINPGQTFPDSGATFRDRCWSSTQGVWVRESTQRLATKPTSQCTHKPRSISFISQLRSWGIWSATLRYSESSGALVPVRPSYTWLGMQGMKCHSSQTTKWQAVNIHFIIDSKGYRHVLLSRSGVYSVDCRHP